MDHGKTSQNGLIKLQTNALLLKLPPTAYLGNRKIEAFIFGPREIETPSIGNRKKSKKIEKQWINASLHELVG